MVRRSTRVSTASLNSASKKRANLSESDFDDGDSSDSDFGNAKKGSARANKKRKVESSASEAEVDEEDEDEDEDDSDVESRPPKVTIIPLPKAREAGDVPYEDGRIHENTMLFLGDLKANNNREWMRFNDEDFRHSQKDFASFVDQLSELVTEKDYTIPELPSKDIIFRVYRDVRFSNDKTPYKPHFSAAWSRTGKKGAYAAYYFHIQPGGQSLIGGGLWQPEAASLDLLRDDIDQNPQRLQHSLMSDGLRRDFFKGAKDEKAALNQFLDMNTKNALKTKPRGYEADHKDIKLLRLRDFTISRKIDDATIVGPDGLQRVADFIGSLVPFITYLNSVVRPDRNAAAAASSDDDGDEADANEE